MREEESLILNRSPTFNYEDGDGSHQSEAEAAYRLMTLEAINQNAKSNRLDLLSPGQEEKDGDKQAPQRQSLFRTVESTGPSQEISNKVKASQSRNQVARGVIPSTNSMNPSDLFYVSDQQKGAIA